MHCASVGFFPLILHDSHVWTRWAASASLVMNPRAFFVTPAHSTHIPAVLAHMGGCATLSMATHATRVSPGLVAPAQHPLESCPVTVNFLSCQTCHLRGICVYLSQIQMCFYNKTTETTILVFLFAGIDSTVEEWMDDCEFDWVWWSRL